MDIIYPLGTGSKWQNNEIRFSIRSAIKNLQELGNIFIIGEKPDFLIYDTEIQGRTIYHIPAEDIFGSRNADGNMIYKTILAGQHPMLKSDFIIFSDDNYILKPMNIKDITPIHRGDIINFPTEYFSNLWGRRLARTRMTLEQSGLPAKHFDHHAPMPMQKELIEPTYEQFDYQTAIGLTCKSLYANIHYRDAPKMTSEKVMIRTHHKINEIRKKTENALYLAHNDSGLNAALKLFLTENFIEPSPFELTQPNDMIVEIAQWVHAGRPYEQGADLFVRYVKGKKNMHKIIKRYNNAEIRKKITYYLEKLLRT